MKIVCAVVAISALVSVGTAAKSCESGWSQYLDTCYIYKADKVTWSAAKSACEALSGQLAEPMSECQNSFLLAMSVDAGDAGSFGPWLGGQKVSDEWQWASSGSAISELFWGSDEPNNATGDENCLHFNEQAWNDLRCYFQNAYFCQKAAV